MIFGYFYISYCSELAGAEAAVPWCTWKCTYGICVGMALLIMDKILVLRYASTNNLSFKWNSKIFLYLFLFLSFLESHAKSVTLCIRHDIQSVCHWLSLRKPAYYVVNKLVMSAVWLIFSVYIVLKPSSLTELWSMIFPRH